MGGACPAEYEMMASKPKDGVGETQASGTVVRRGAIGISSEPREAMHAVCARDGQRTLVGFAPS